jgi:hypothetical protein
MKIGLIQTLPKCNQMASETQDVKFGMAHFGNELLV